jgi:hypothetical protein
MVHDGVECALVLVDGPAWQKLETNEVGHDFYNFAMTTVRL